MNVNHTTFLAVELADQTLRVRFQPGGSAIPEGAALAALSAVRQHLEQHRILYRVEVPEVKGESHPTLIIPLPCRA